MYQQTFPEVARHAFKLERQRQQERLAALIAEFDEHYQYSDDPRVFAKHNNLAQRINTIEQNIQQLNTMLANCG